MKTDDGVYVTHKTPNDYVIGTATGVVNNDYIIVSLTNDFTAYSTTYYGQENKKDWVHGYYYPITLFKCSFCGRHLKRTSLKNHLRNIHPEIFVEAALLVDEQD